SVENATIFSPKDPPVHISAQEIPSGGVLIEVRDSGVGIPEARLAEMNLRLDNPHVIDVSVSRHMGLFAVARLAERHGVRVRLRAGTPQGLAALVWLPDSLAEREARLYSNLPQQVATFQARRTPGHRTTAVSSATGGRAASYRPDAVAPAMRTGAGTSETVQAADSAASNWFRSRRPPATGTGQAYGGPPEPFPRPGGGTLPGTGGWAGGRPAAPVIA